MMPTRASPFLIRSNKSIRYALCLKEIVDCLDNPGLLSFAQLPVNRKRQRLVRGRFGDRERPAPIPQAAKARLQVQGDRIVHLGADPAGLKIGAKVFPFRDANDELVVDMCALGRPRRKRHGADETGFVEQRFVPLRIAAARRGPVIEMRKLHAQDRGLERIEPEIRADQIVMIFDLAAVLPDRAHLARKRAVGRRHQTRVAERTQILRRKEREAAERTDASDGPAPVARANCLRRILDDRHTGAFRNLENRRHVGALAKEVHG